MLAGYCEKQKGLRAFRIETDAHNQRSKSEVLIGHPNIEIFGSGETAARKLMPTKPTEYDIINVLHSVITDSTVAGVGGNMQFGCFYGRKFQPQGVGVRTDEGVHYWRALLDLNGPESDQATGLVPNFRCLDLINFPPKTAV